MNLTQILAFLKPFEAILEPMLLAAEQGTVMPELNALVASVSSPDLKLLLGALVAALDGFAQAEIKKLEP